MDAQYKQPGNLQGNNKTVMKILNKFSSLFCQDEWILETQSVPKE